MNARVEHTRYRPLASRTCKNGENYHLINCQSIHFNMTTQLFLILKTMKFICLLKYENDGKTLMMCQFSRGMDIVTLESYKIEYVN